MGTLYYDDQSPIPVEDELLEHLAVVVATKFRRREPFLITLGDSASSTVPRSTLWLAPTASCRFVFDSLDGHTLDLQLLRRLMLEATSNAGIVLEDVPDASELATSTPSLSPSRY